MLTIKIKNLRLRTIIGINETERSAKQDIIINAILCADSDKAFLSDDIGDTCNYRSISKKIISVVEESKFHLLEKLADKVLDIIMKDASIKKATVEIDKPNALRFSDSVSVEVTKER